MADSTSASEKTVPTSELIRPALDWVVASIEYPDDTLVREACSPEIADLIAESYTFSTDWSEGGPIIDRMQPTIVSPRWDRTPRGEWGVVLPNGKPMRGPTLLIAAMRCYVASHFGDEVSIPAELLPGAPK